MVSTIVSNSINMNYLLAFFTFIALASGCTETAVQSVTDTLIIRTGTSFGMCVGDKCRKDYLFTGTSGTLTHGGNSRGTPIPPKTCQKSISAADWNVLKAAVNLSTFGQQPERIGCPDCADGGAEYIELEQGDSKHRVTFPYGQTIPGFEPLVTALREQRNQFNSCP